MAGGLSQLESWTRTPGHRNGRDRSVDFNISPMVSTHLGMLPDTASRCTFVLVARRQHERDDPGKGAYMMMRGDANNPGERLPTNRRVAEKALKRQASLPAIFLNSRPRLRWWTRQRRSLSRPKYSRASNWAAATRQKTCVPRDFD